MFNEPASSQDSLKKTYTEKRISTTCADTLILSKETLGSAEEKGMPDLIDNVSYNSLIKMFLLACTEICCTVTKNFNWVSLLPVFV